MSEELPLDLGKCIRRFEMIIRREFPELLIDIDWGTGRITVTRGSCSAVVTFTDAGKPYWDEYCDSDFRGKNDKWVFGFQALIDKSAA